MYLSSKVIAEIWALRRSEEQCRWLLCSHTDGILSFFSSSRKTAACWILINTMTKPHWAFFLSNFLSLKSIDGLFVLLLYLKRECMKQICFVPTQSLAALLILKLLILQLSLPAALSFFFQQASLIKILFLFYLFLIRSWHLRFDVLRLWYKILTE